MGRRRPPAALLAALLAAVMVAAMSAGALAGCSDDEPRGPASAPETTTPPASGTPSATPSDEPTGDAAGGTAEEPLVVEPVTELLAWTPLGGDTSETVTTNGTHTLTVSRDGKRAVLEDADGARTPLGEGGRVSDALLDDDWAVVVRQDPAEERPAVATVVELATGDQRTVDRRSPVPTTTGGTWALRGDTVLHATTGPDGAYCLAERDLATDAAEVAWCAEPRHGFNAAHATDSGTSLMTFDDTGCRTVVALVDGGAEPFPGVARCKGWDGVLLGEGAVWTVVPKADRVEAGLVRARAGSGYVDLGPATSGSLVECGGAAWWARDPRTDGEPAALMRWDGSELAVVYESPPGQAFLSAPRCAGSQVSVTAYAEGGDEQVTAPAL
ncbi:hypothetical protein [Nocardioides sp. SYSU D00038]|uniref:hypothetical protein n=1 Tax=Nocardioides sp. SYSU D00038 TaxID=2812554 RepID=UPI0019670431|nr:hypothetical protein [Nocardioides sp. SYSU D00038]